MNLSKEKLRQIFGFLIAGIIGFLLEYAIINYFVQNFEVNAIAPRFLSFPLAVLLTWYINRRLGFNRQTPPNLSELIRFVRSTALAQATNFISYSIILIYIPYLSALIALLIASIISINVSFFLYLKYVFR